MQVSFIREPDLQNQRPAISIPPESRCRQDLRYLFKRSGCFHNRANIVQIKRGFYPTRTCARRPGNLLGCCGIFILNQVGHIHGIKERSDELMPLMGFDLSIQQKRFSRLLFRIECMLSPWNVASRCLHNGLPFCVNDLVARNSIELDLC